MFVRHSLRKFLLFSLWGDPLENPRRAPAPQGCVSSEKQRSFEVPGGEGFRKEGDGGDRKQEEGKKDAQKVASCPLHR